jgi:hypothetical protein
VADALAQGPRGQRHPQLPTHRGTDVPGRLEVEFVEEPRQQFGHPTPRVELVCLTLAGPLTQAPARHVRTEQSVVAGQFLGEEVEVSAHAREPVDADDGRCVGIAPRGVVQFRPVDDDELVGSVE